MFRILIGLVLVPGIACVLNHHPFFKQLLLLSFDPLLAQAMGIQPLLPLSADDSFDLVSVTAMQSVGTILIVALLITPAATAYLLCQQSENYDLCCPRVWELGFCAGTPLSATVLMSLQDPALSWLGPHLSHLFYCPKPTLLKLKNQPKLK